MAGAASASFAGVAEAIWQAAMALQQPTLAGFSVEILPQIDSTNSELMRRARSGRTEPTLLVAQQQTAGRGRLGRAWLSGAAHEMASVGATTTSRAGPPQAASTPLGGSAAHEVASVGAPSLTFSLGLLLQPPTWDGLSLAVGTSVADSLHPSVGLKWPNDLWVDGRKLAGILIETAPATHGARYAVIGVGINIAPCTADGLATAPAALRELLPQATPATALGTVAPALLRDVLLFEREGFAAFASRFSARDVLLGRSVDVLPTHPGPPDAGSLAPVGHGVCHGVGQGVDARGALLLRTLAGLQAITSSEVSVRPRSSPEGAF